MLGLLINMVAPVTELLRVALSSFRQLYDLLGDCVSGWGNWPVRIAKTPGVDLVFLRCRRPKEKPRWSGA